MALTCISRLAIDWPRAGWFGPRACYNARLLAAGHGARHGPRAGCRCAGAKRFAMDPCALAATAGAAAPAVRDARLSGAYAAQAREREGAPLMSLLTEYGRDFSGDVKSRGREYFRSGAVKITSHDETQVKATVDGTSRYRVTVGWDDADDAPVYHCTCPFCGEGGAEPCKHCWATVLKADADGVLPKPPDWEEGGGKSGRAD